MSWQGISFAFYSLVLSIDMLIVLFVLFSTSWFPRMLVSPLANRLDRRLNAQRTLIQTLSVPERSPKLLFSGFKAAYGPHLAGSP